MVTIFLIVSVDLVTLTLCGILLITAKKLKSVGVGKLFPNLTTEVDCESLFSKTGYKSHPRHTLNSIKNYEWLVVTKHHMICIYIPEIKVQNLFLKHRKKND